MVMGQMQINGRKSTRDRCARAMKSKVFDSLRDRRLFETTAEHFLVVLNNGKVWVAHYLRRLHNLALGLGWIAVPVLAPKLWPKPEYKSKRAITLAEHEQIIAAEKNAERGLFYQLLWEIGASQSDAAALTAELSIDWKTETLTYFRLKTGERSSMTGSRKSSSSRKGRTSCAAPLINGSGATDFCARFLDSTDKPIKGLTVTLESWK